RVAKLMGVLPPAEQVIWMPRRVAAPARARSSERHVWAAAALALAAGVAIAIWLAPKPEEEGRPVEAKVQTVTPAVVDPVQTVEIPVVRPSARPPVEERVVPMARPASTRPVRRAPSRPVFVSLDDEPVETGIILRVALGEAGIPADVIFGTDGRAHAIRLVSNPTQK